MSVKCGAWKTKSGKVNWKVRKSELESFLLLTVICSSRREHYIPRREHYISRREHYISRRELENGLQSSEDYTSLFRTFQFAFPDFSIYSTFGSEVGVREISQMLLCLYIQRFKGTPPGDRRER